MTCCYHEAFERAMRARAAFTPEVEGAMASLLDAMAELRRAALAGGDVCTAERHVVFAAGEARWFAAQMLRLAERLDGLVFERELPAEPKAVRTARRRPGEGPGCA